MVATGGYIAAMAAGGTWDSLYDSYVAAMQQHVLAPMAMRRSTFSFDSVRADGNYAVPHGARLDGTYTPIPLSAEQFATPIAPAGGLWSTANDMARYLLTELARGVAPDGRRVVSAANLAVTWQPQVKVSAQQSYGLGWLIDDYKGQTVINHGGNTMGFTSDLAFLPQANLGIVVLANAQGSTLFNEAVRYRLLELVFKQPFATDAQVTAALAQTQQARASIALAPTIDAAAVRPFLGTYTNAALGTLTLALQNGALVAQTESFSTTLQALRGPTSQVGTYLSVDPPQAGQAFRASRDSSGAPVIVLGGGAAEYTFTRVK
jgi:CubicO group peptidase (beta-lactamase class C family)